MLSEQLLNVMKMFCEPSLYQDFSTSTEITNVINQLSLGQLNTNREKYVISCLILSVQEALESSIQKVADSAVMSDLTKLVDELKQFQSTLLSEERVMH
jgi:hypothetical protein